MKTMNVFQCIFGTNNKLVEAIAARDWPEVQYQVARRPRKARSLYRIVSFQGPTVILPLHHCLMLDAPYQVVRSIIRAYPVALFLCDSLKKRYPLHIACEATPQSLHQLEVVNTLLEAAPDIVMVRDQSGNLPLHHAVLSKAKFNVIEALLQNSGTAAVAQPNGKGWYPLHLACAGALPYPIVQELVVAWPDGVLKQVNGRVPSDIVYAGDAADKSSILLLLQEEAAEAQILQLSAAPHHSMMISVANSYGRFAL